MRNAYLIALFGTLFAFFLTVFPGASSADHVGQSLSVDGMDIYLGLKAMDTSRGKPKLHMGHHAADFPSGGHVYHLLLAVFDHSSGKRVTDAVVDATVAPLGLAGRKKSLYATVLAGTLTYCNYFRISPRDAYVIRVEIRRPETTQITRANFALERHTE